MNIKKVKNKVPVISLILAFIVFVTGLLVFLLPDEIIKSAFLVVFIAFLIVFGFSRAIIGLLDGKTVRGIISFAVCANLVLVILGLNNRLDSAVVLPSIIVGAVSLLMGIIRVMISVNCFINHFRGGVRNAISAVLCLGFGLFMVVHPIKNFPLMTTVAGIYLMIYSFTMFGDAFAAMFRTDLNENRKKRRRHFAMPNLITAVKPTRMISQINSQIEAGKLQNGMLIEEKNQDLYDHVNLEILVHLTTQGANKFGHVDIAIGDRVYSYGTYDESKVKFAGFVAQGSFIDIDKIPYLRYCLDVQQKYVIGFGACLSDEQLATVKGRVERFIEENCEFLPSAYDLAVKEGKDGSELDDRPSIFSRDLGGKTYSVVSGAYKRYFGININCVQFADWLLNDSGIDAMSFSGLRTPGAYYAMLDNMFKRKNTRVIRKISYILSKDIKYIEKIGQTE